jgi:hypothetical protein
LKPAGKSRLEVENFGCIVPRPKSSDTFKCVITDDPIFGLKVQNLSIINIRKEFGAYLAALSDDIFVSGISMIRPVEFPLFTWRGLPMGALTVVLQRSVLGVESCVSAAVEYQLTARRMLTDETAALLNDAGNLPGKRRGMADAFYNKLPALVDPSLRLEIMEPELWASVKQFYREVRNPLFHGYELSTINAAGAREALEMLARVYMWMDSWWGAFGPVTARKAAVPVSPAQ